MWSRALIAAGVAGVLGLGIAACSAGHDDVNVTYRVTGRTEVSSVVVRYGNADGVLASDSVAAGKVDWTKEVVLGEHASTAHVSASYGSAETSTSVSFTCVILIDGKEVKKQTGWPQCSVTVELDDL